MRNGKKYAMRAAVCMGFGMVCGIAWACMMGAAAFQMYAQRLAQYLADLPRGEGVQVAWIESFAKYIWLLAAIWLLAFYPRASRVGYVVCAAKSAGFGFVLGSFGRAFGGWGVQQAFVLAGLQNIVILLAALCATVAGRLYDEKVLTLRIYMLAGGVFAAVAALMAAIEALVLPIVL